MVTLGPARADGQAAKVESVFEVLVQGEPHRPVFLPLPGYGAGAMHREAGRRRLGAGAGRRALRHGGASRLAGPRAAPASSRPRRALPHRARRACCRPKLGRRGRSGCACWRWRRRWLRRSSTCRRSSNGRFRAPCWWADRVDGGRRRVDRSPPSGAPRRPSLTARRRFAQGEEKALAPGGGADPLAAAAGRFAAARRPALRGVARPAFGLRGDACRRGSRST